ncbi:MAG: hypothetical protein ACXV3A_12900 [Kineosporiaceae bacterium]
MTTAIRKSPRTQPSAAQPLPLLPTKLVPLDEANRRDAVSALAELLAAWRDRQAASTLGVGSGGGFDADLERAAEGSG